MTPLQQKLLEMLSWFHFFCEKNHLRYYILGGTFLGAVRHQGFIPWDDDVDVGMPTVDYLKFISLTKNLPQPYYVESPFNAGPDFCYPYTKLYDTRTTLVENRRVVVKRGVFLDIFPLCGIGNSTQETLSQFGCIYSQRLFAEVAMMAPQKERSWYKNLLVYMAKIIPFCVARKLSFSIHAKILKLNFYHSQYVGTPVGAWGFREIMPRNLFGKTTLYVFENLSVYGPEKPDEYLTHLYGNWRQLPPTEKQKSHHAFLCLDLKKSYLNESK